MKRPEHPRRLLENDLVPWTRDKLEQRIRETERLVERLGEERLDPDYHWLRHELLADLERKRRMLARM